MEIQINKDIKRRNYGSFNPTCPDKSSIQKIVMYFIQHKEAAC